MSIQRVRSTQASMPIASNMAALGSSALGLGMVIGSMATWWKQGRYRKEAKAKSQEVQQLPVWELWVSM